MMKRLLFPFLAIPQIAFAAAPGATGHPFVDGMLSTVIYGVLGIAMATVSFKVIDWKTPGSLAEELTEKKNVALAIVTGFWILGVSIIIAAAIAG